MQLVITEKPSVAKSIAQVVHATEAKNGYLQGDGYLVSWCVGHLVELASADSYREEWKKWSYEQLPIIPDVWQYKVKESTRKQYEVLKTLLHDPKVSEVVCATDAGREGELIFRLVYEQAGCTKPFKRLWISSMEERVIVDGFANLRDGREYDNLYLSALCRSEADWLVGINATRLFTVLYRHRLTVGRVQTPTLAMMVEREQSISDFKKERYFMVHLLCGGLDAVTGRIDEQDKAEEIMGACQKGQALVVSVKQEEKSVYPPKLYDLTTLQRDANRLFGFTAQQTLDYTQSLYEQKLVTYPRTDSQFLTDDMERNALESAVAVQMVFPFMQSSLPIPDVGRVMDSKKVSDHHAIIPTVEIRKTDLGKVPGGERQILSLIAMRLLCATGEVHKIESVKAELECNGILFTAFGKTILQNGWKTTEEQFLKEYKTGKKNEKEEVPLPGLAEGMTFHDVDTKVSEHYTSPPKHFTEDTLLSAMEHAGSEEMGEEVERKGLGTPATRAAIIEKLVEKGFVERKNKQMLPTEDGVKLITVLPEVIKSPKLTAEWENDLTLIAKGEKSSEVFMEGIEAMVSALVHTYHEVDESKQGMFSSDREVVGRCPKCGGNVYEGRTNFYCENRDCDFALFKNNRYFASMRKELSRPVVQALLMNGKAKVSGLYSKKKDSTFTAIIHMDVSGKYPQFSMTFDGEKGSKGKKANHK